MSDPPKTGKYTIDLNGCASLTDVVRETARVLSASFSTKYENSGGLQAGNLDALGEVIADWFVEHWGEHKVVVIKGARSVAHVDPVLPAVIANIVGDGFTSAISEAMRDGSDRRRR